MNRVARLLAVVPFSLGCALACHDASDARPSLVLAPRILAIQAEPAEVVPGADASYRVLAVDGAGELTDEPARWSYCQAVKAAGDGRIAAPSCVQRSQLPFDREGRDVQGRVPSDACERFGPNVPAGSRPNDPDATGGYYQPLRVRADEAVAVGLHRILCPLPNVPRDVALELRDRYVANRNPRIGGLLATEAVRPGQRALLALIVARTEAERFVLYDEPTVTLVERRERLRAAWYATGGELTIDRIDLIENEGDELRADNTWRAPSVRGRVHLWVVLRDDRGGMSFTGVKIDVR